MKKVAPFLASVAPEYSSSSASFNSTYRTEIAAITDLVLKGVVLAPKGTD